jgi:pimeloyl-ACP methyl ester carboxylesterase
MTILSDITSLRAIAHDGTDIPIVVTGSGDRFLFLSYGTASALDANAMKPWVDGLGDEYRLIFIEYPGEVKLYTLTPPTVARDFLAVADAAGAKEFAYYGYSWGAVTGLQLAIRTNRMTAFIAGGFPMVHGPYAEMLKMDRAAAEGRNIWDWGDQEWGEGSGGADSAWTREQWEAYRTPWELVRQYMTYYEGLQSFDDRAAQQRIRCPRFNFVGGKDVVGTDEFRTDISQTVRAHRDELASFGWTVEILEGLNHLGAMAPSTAIPVIRQWLATSRPSERPR